MLQAVSRLASSPSGLPPGSPPACCKHASCSCCLWDASATPSLPRRAALKPDGCRPAWPPNAAVAVWPRAWKGWQGRADGARVQRRPQACGARGGGQGARAERADRDAEMSRGRRLPATNSPPRELSARSRCRAHARPDIAFPHGAAQVRDDPPGVRVTKTAPAAPSGREGRVQPPVASNPKAMAATQSLRRRQVMRDPATSRTDANRRAGLRHDCASLHGDPYPP